MDYVETAGRYPEHTAVFPLFLNWATFDIHRLDEMYYGRANEAVTTVNHRHHVF